MPTFQELLDSIKNPQEHQTIRLDLIKEIEDITNRNLIVYAVDFTKNNPQVPNSINWVDKTGFSDLIEDITGKKLDIFLHSPGGSAEAVEQMGAVHKDTSHGEIAVDENNKIVTTPCYMLDANILQIAEGAENLVKKVLELI